MEKHPVRVVYVNVSNIEFVGYVSGDDIQEKNYGVEIGFSHSPYNVDDKSIHLKGRAIVGQKLEPEDERSAENPFYLQLILTARFEVDEDLFDVAYIEEWAKGNAPMLLMPYMREHVSSLAIRCGYLGVSLPLIQVPRYRSDQDFKDEEPKE